MEKNLSKTGNRPMAINIILVIFIIWALFIFVDFSGIKSHRVNGQVVNVILGFSIYGIYAKIMDVIQLTSVLLMIYGLFRMKKLFGLILPIAYLIYAFVSMHSYSIMAVNAPLSMKIIFDLIQLLGGGLISIILYMNRKNFT